RLLKIKTQGRDESIANHINYPYEPTPYSVLERLAASEYIGKKNVLLDYGCGKGRVDFYLSYQTRCRSIGVDYDGRMIGTALENQKTGVSGNRVQFVCENAAAFMVPKDVDRCYFFNPFSVEVLKGVLSRIMESYYENPREILLFFYYPSEDYVANLVMQDELTFCDEIACNDLFEGENDRERILIFSIG
ncbi:MAG: class I SAM-dependent methyltransferase, partial [Eubacteriales bacterium]|nr:class I SAM-dependent methyltransferase [Eubacteriales bacterium]